MEETAGTRFDRLVEIMRTLRSPHGCPWDREQTLRSLRPFILEETYELLDALDSGDLKALGEELGDFLYEAVFLAQIAEENGHFGIGHAIQTIIDKLVRRHPHVFTPDGRPLVDAREEMTSAAVIEKWEDHKARERQTEGGMEKTILSGVPRALPALLRAYELSARAAAVGFDWVRTNDVLEKIDEELAELREVVEATDARRAEEEMGDFLFSIVNLARKLGIEPEGALRAANTKFQRRFERLERHVRSRGGDLRDLSLSQLDEYWQSAKTQHDGDEERETS